MNAIKEFVLLIAAVIGDLRTIQAIMKSTGSLKSAHNADGVALMLATWAGQRDVVNFLIRIGTNVSHNETVKGFARLIDLIPDQNMQEILRWVRTRGKRGKSVVTALHIAIMNHDESLARDLINAGADIKIKTTKSVTLLDFAVRYGMEDIASHMIKLDVEGELLADEVTCKMMSDVKSGKEGTISKQPPVAASGHESLQWHQLIDGATLQFVFDFMGVLRASTQTLMQGRGKMASIEKQIQKYRRA